MTEELHTERQDPPLCSTSCSLYLTGNSCGSFLLIVSVSSFQSQFIGIPEIMGFRVYSKVFTSRDEPYFSAMGTEIPQLVEVTRLSWLD